MIGIHTRGLRHFKRSAPLNTPLYFFLGRIDNTIEGEVLKVKTSDGEFLMLFNNRRNHNAHYMSDIKRSFTKDSEIAKTISNLENKYGGVLIFHTFNKSEQNMWENYLPALLMPENFNENYSIFCESNKKLFASIFSNYTSPYAPIARRFYAMCNGSPNMFVWALNNFYKAVPFQLIVDILYWFENYNQLSGKLKKGSITSYNGTQAILKLQEELVTLRQEKRIASVFNMFNTQQKKLLKSATLNKQEREMLSHFETLSKEKQINFIRKVSTLDTVDEIFHQMALLTKVHFDWKRESFLDFITHVENLSFDIIYDNNNIIILHIKDYDTIKYVTRTTNWCISKNKRYWDDYTTKKCDNRKQYVLFDFNQKEDSELSIVGFTTKDDRDICFAHSFTNVNLMDGRDTPPYQELESFRPRLKNNIYNILTNLSIGIDKFVATPSLPYAWNKESLLNILNGIDEANYNIIKDENNVLVFTISSPNHIFDIIGAEQYSNILKFVDYNPLEEKHFFICDFNKEGADKIVWSFISRYNGGETCENIFNSYGKFHNQSLNFVLWEYNLPMSIFARPMDTFLLLMESFSNIDIKMLSILLKQDDVKQLLNSGNSNLRKRVMSTLKATLFNYCSIDLLKLFYENGYKLTSVIGAENVDMLLKHTIDYLVPRAKYIKVIPTYNDYQKLFKGQFNENKSLVIGFFLIHQMIWEHESSPLLIKQWIFWIHSLPKFMRKHYIDEILPFINQIASKDKKECFANLIIDSEYYDIFEKHIFEEDLMKIIYNKMHDTNPWKKKIFSKECVASN